MVIFDLIQYMLNAQFGGLFQPCGPLAYHCNCAAQNALCPASAFTAIGAAFATEGYWIQSDMIYYLTSTTFGLWAPLIYIIAAAGGLTGVALGMPPKNYMWFFMGPVIYQWLLGTTQGVTGVEWQVAGVPADQREVWKLSEVGLRNSSYAVRNAAALQFFNNAPPQEAGSVATVQVSTLFLWVDELISSEVQWMIRWTGVYNQEGNTPAGGSTNLADPPAGRNGGTDPRNRRWYLLSNLKWSMLENITSARLQSPDMRDAFVTFMASECGEALGKSIDEAKFIAAANAKGVNIPDSILIDKVNNYREVTQNLVAQSVPFPPSLKRVVSTPGVGSFRDFISFASGFAGFGTPLDVMESITCDGYLWLLVHGFRWEAGHIYHQLVNAAPGKVLPDEVVYNLFYGWDIKDPATGAPLPAGNPQRWYLEDLILVHLFRNELAIAPKPVDQRWSTKASSSASESYVEAYQRSIGSKNKFGEIYSWALMVPYLQGILLYFLAMAYPFVCMLVVIPGWHKIVFTWISFWAWVKLWDVGFAIVIALEKSIWAMLGNDSNAKVISDRVITFQGLGNLSRLDITCPVGGILSDPGNPMSCSVPVVHSCCSGAVHPFILMQPWKDSLYVLDNAMLLGSSLDLDLANSYYIYIMAALYFAVPTVTGQLVLGAKSGASGMVNSMVGGISQETGKAAGNAASSEAVTAMHSNTAAVGQTAMAKDMRKSGLGQKAMEFGNQGLREDIAGSALGTASQNAKMYSDSLANQRQSYSSALGITTAGAAFASRLMNDWKPGGGGFNPADGTGGARRGATANEVGTQPGDRMNANPLGTGEGSDGRNPPGIPNNPTTGSASAGKRAGRGGAGGGKRGGPRAGALGAGGVGARAGAGGGGAGGGAAAGGAGGSAGGGGGDAGGGDGGGGDSGGDGGMAGAAMAGGGASGGGGGSVGGGGGARRGGGAVGSFKGGSGGRSSSGGGASAVTSGTDAGPGNNQASNPSASGSNGPGKSGGGAGRSAVNTANAMLQAMGAPAAVKPKDNPMMAGIFRAGRMAGPMADWIASAGNNKMTQATLADATNVNGMAADMGIGQFRHGGASRGLGLAGQRTQSEAGFSADQARWDAMNKFSAGITGTAAALGAYAGTFNPGQKPTDMTGMAMSGMLNTRNNDARGSAKWADPGSKGGFFDSTLNPAAQNLQSNYGGNYVRSGFRNWSTGAATMNAGIAFGEAMSAPISGAKTGAPSFGTRDGVGRGIDTQNGKTGALSPGDRQGRGTASSLPGRSGPDPTPGYTTPTKSIDRITGT